MDKNKVYAILSLISIIAIILWNYYINTAGINGNTVGSLSDDYANLFTPAGYAFSIWGIIFLALLAHGVQQVKAVFFDKNSEAITVHLIGGWLFLVNTLNALWLWVWLNEKTLLSVAVMLLILSSLMTIVVKLNMQKNKVENSIKIWTWAPISLYSGWITVATIANVSAFLAKIKWGAWGLSESTWATIMIATAVIVFCYILFSRHMKIYTSVGVWALVAIAVRHWNTIPMVQWAAAIGALILAIAIAVEWSKNRGEDFSKIIKGENNIISKEGI